MNAKKPIEIVVGLIALGLLVSGYFYFSRPSVPAKIEKKGAVGTAETVSEGVPKITTNPVDKMPEINPLDRANPFKYINPLR